jgi:hypothetical protein
MIFCLSCIMLIIGTIPWCAALSLASVLLALDRVQHFTNNLQRFTITNSLGSRGGKKFVLYFQVDVPLKFKENSQRLNIKSTRIWLTTLLTHLTFRWTISVRWELAITNSRKLFDEWTEVGISEFRLRRSADLYIPLIRQFLLVAK